MRTTWSAVSFLAALGAVGAPMQCAREPDPTSRREDTAGDALWALAQEFKARGEPAAAQSTLRFLVERYPSSRYVPRAREELAPPNP